MNKYFVVEFMFEKPILVLVYSEKETNKTITISDYKEILGWMYIGKRLRKESTIYFSDIKEAIEWLLTQNRLEKEKYEQSWKTLTENTNTLLELLTLADEYNNR